MARSMGNEVPASAAAPKRRFIEAPATVGEAPAVAADHLDVGQQVMAEGDRLRHLQVGEARHDRGRVLLGPVDERSLQVAAGRVGLVQARAEPEPQVGRHLVVARARGVQPPGGRTDERGEPGLDVHVDVFQRAVEGEAAGLDLVLHPVQAVRDRVGVLLRHDPLLRQHGDVG